MNQGVCEEKIDKGKIKEALRILEEELAKTKETMESRPARETLDGKRSPDK
jgi:hypothetical protein